MHESFNSLLFVEPRFQKFSPQRKRFMHESFVLGASSFAQRAEQLLIIAVFYGRLNEINEIVIYRRRRRQVTPRRVRERSETCFKRLLSRLMSETGPRFKKSVRSV